MCILADSSRVCLSKARSESDYINACYIDVSPLYINECSNRKFEYRDIDVVKNFWLGLDPWNLLVLTSGE